jgi:hypothetical protein
MDRSFSYKQSLKKVHQLEQQGGVQAGVDELPTIDTTITPNDPCKDVKELLMAEHETRSEAGQALDHCNAENQALTTANTELHEGEALLIEKVELKDQQVQVIAKDRDSQVTRKKLWRDTAIVAVLLKVLPLLF